jgi:hypothetical protein
MFDHEPERFGEPEDRIRRLTPGIRQVLDREKRPVNVIVTVDQEQLHVRKVTKEPRFPTSLLLLILLLLLLLVFGALAEKSRARARGCDERVVAMRAIHG